MAAFDFSRPNSRFQLGLADWHFVVELAERNGWKPAGTVFPETPAELELFERISDPEERESAQKEDQLLRDYFSNSGQRVTEGDAEEMAAAIEQALGDIPDHDAIGTKDKRDALPHRIAGYMRDMPGDQPMPGIRDRISVFEWFSGGEKQRLRDFIEFCRAGGFNIN